MWVRKKENEYILAMLDRLEMLKETPSGVFRPTHARLQTLSIRAEADTETCSSLSSKMVAWNPSLRS